MCSYTFFIRRMKHLWLIALCLAASVASTAQQRSDGEMLRIARQHVKANNVKKLKAANAYAIYGAQGKGFVVVGSRQGRNAVLGFSDSDFDESQMPDGLRWWLNAVEECAEAAAPIAATATGKSVEPFIKTRWGQEDPYNRQCPKIDNTAAPTGCVATAMAQVLKYYEYPEKGTGKGSYYLDDAVAPKQGRMYGSPYDYADMLDVYDDWNPTRKQRDAVAYLMRDCGYATAMKYTLDGSGATPFDATNGFVNNFSYDPLAIKCEIRDYVGEEKWMETIYATLDAKQPIIYLGADETYGGHAFILDGYDEKGLVHVNWGWDGNADGYFSLADLAVTGILGFNTTLRFNQNQYMIYGFRTSPEPEAGQVYTSQWGMYMPDAISVTEDGKGLSVTFFGLFNIHYKPFTGYIGLAFESLDNPANSGFQPIDNHLSNVAALGGESAFAPSQGTFSGSELASLKAGRYHLYLGSFSDEEINRDANAVPAIYPGGVSDYTLVKATDGTLTLTDNTPTGINAMHNEECTMHNDKAVYDLRGRRVTEKRLKSGVYVVGGRKFVVK